MLAGRRGRLAADEAGVVIMKLTGLLLAVLLGFAPLPQTQRRPATAARTTGQVALAVRVSD
ncbi:MAG: hypothetical protein ABJC51_01180, partial [Acidobacteriota bacterium]